MARVAFTAMTVRVAFTATIMVLAARPACAIDTGSTQRAGELIQPYEPITAGYTKDGDDVPYLDVTLSLKFALLPPRWTLPDGLFLAFTGRFGFYWGTRDSSPVIGKSYNPKLFWRHVLANAEAKSAPLAKGAASEYTSYLDFGYAHQSNGQSIHTPEQYGEAQHTAQRPEFANEYISRGWDYLEVIWKHSYRENKALSSSVDARFFLHDGLLQGHPEEYNVWEMSSEGKPRRAVDGLTAMLEYQTAWAATLGGISLPGDPSFWIKYQTGYDSPFKFNTVRAEAGAHVLELPVVLWVQRGYVSDLANYYRKTTSYGLELRFGEF